MFLGLMLISGTILAQERVYVPQLSPPQIHSFSFGGTGFTREDLDPADAARTALKTSSEAFRLATTDHFFVNGIPAAQTGIGLVDPDGIVLPLPATNIGTGAALQLSSLREFAFMVSTSPAGYGVADLRPTSANFLKQIVSCLPADPCGLGAGIADGAVLGPGGSYLYIVRTRGGFTDRAAMIDAVDVSQPSNPVIRSSTPIAMYFGFDRAALRLRLASVGGKNYLFLMRRDLQIIEIGSDPKVLTLVTTIQSVHPTSGFRRSFLDVHAVDTAQGPRAFATVNSAIDDPPTAFSSEILTVDLTAPLTGAPDASEARILSSFNLNAVINAGNALTDSPVQLLRPSGSGSVLFNLTQATTPGSRQTRLLALDVGELSTGSGDALLDMVLLDDQDENGVPDLPAVDAIDLLVSERVVRPAVDPVLSDATTPQLDGTPGRLVINDTPRTLTITGSDLGTVSHAFLGPDWLTGVSAAANQVVATVPKLAPSGQPILAVVTSNGAVSAFHDLRVVNPPSFLPATVGYVANNSDNTVSVLNAASATEIADTFPSVQGPSSAKISRDGRLLFVGGFRDGNVAVHCIVADPDGTRRGFVCDWNELATLIPVAPAGAAAQMAMHATRDRLYVNTVWPDIAIIDTAAAPPVMVGQIAVSELNDEWFRGLTRGMATGGDWLYVGNDRDPHILAVPIGDDSVEGDPSLGSDIVGTSIPDIAGSIGRSDGVAVHGSKLYFTNFFDTAVRVFDIDPTDGSHLTAAGTIPIPGASADIRNLAITQDGRHLGVASRTAGTTDVFDLQSAHGGCDTPPCHVVKIATGLGSNELRSSPSGEFFFVPASARGAVTIIDLRDGEPSQYTALTASGAGAGAGNIALTPGLETETGTNVEVTPAEGVDIVFENVTTPGSTTVTSANVSEVPLPADFVIAGDNNVAVYYDVKSTATFEGPVSICFDYAEGLSPEETANLRVLHEETCTQELVDEGKCVAGELGSVVFVDRTDPGVSPNPDPVNHKICALVNSFSLFVVAAINAPPTFTPAAAVTRKAGSTGTTATVGTVADVEDDAGSLTVTATVPAGLTVTGIANNGGTITATIATSCAATVGAKTVTFQVQDSAGATSTAGFTVNVAANFAPVLGTYSHKTITAGGATTVIPSVAPTDNGTFTVTASAAPAGYTGTLTANSSTGRISIGSANPPGTYEITVTATDACSAVSTATFNLIVNTAPAITPAAAVSRTAGGTAATATIATVTDSENAAGTLTVTATSVPAGLTVSSISNSGGTVTATIAASCSTTPGEKTVALRVQDGDGATATANLTVNVSANSVPTLGNYNSTSVDLGGTTTATPSAAPADNGTVTVTASASAGFTGTLSANSATGVVTIGNANSGTYTITVLATDNCSATATKSFTLNVSNVIVAPSNLVARATSGSNINLTWIAVGAAHHYEVDRNAGAGFVPIGTPATNAFSDSGRAANTAYLYRVRAIGNGGQVSVNSNIDIATTRLFTDDPLVARSTVIHASHITQLRVAVNAVRRLAGIGDFSFSDSSIAGLPMRATHVTELRSALDAARAALSLPAVVYTNPISTGASIRAADIAEIRAGTK